MMNDISSLLLTIAGASASFVAILGGFIASKLIAINSERDATQSKLKEIKYQKFLTTEERDMLRRSMDEEDAICYIHNHMEDVVSGVALDEVYEENELQLIDFEILLPYWKKAQIYIELFDEHMHADTPKLNSDYIPNDLAEEYIDDLFAYEFLKIYAGWGFSDYFEDCEPMTRRDWYDVTKKRVMELNTRAASLNIQEQIYDMDLNRLKQPKGMKIGLLVFALFSVFNIILPLFLSAAPLTGQWYSIVLYCSIGSLTLGLCATFWYLARMLKWKESQ
jgi:hypothetical protein